MKYSEWLPRFSQRLETDPDYQEAQRRADSLADALREALTPEQLTLVSRYLDCREYLSLLKTFHAYAQGNEDAKRPQP